MMKKSELANRIIDSVGNPENVYVSDFNKKVLSELAETEFTGETDDEAVETLEKLLKTFLKETWPEKPQSHKFIVGSCLALAFLFEKPLHPQDKVNFIIRVENGKKNYYCPYNEKGTICDFCAAKPLVNQS